MKMEVEIAVMCLQAKQPTVTDSYQKVEEAWSTFSSEFSEKSNLPIPCFLKCWPFELPEIKLLLF